MENVCGIQREEYCGRAKGALVVAAREALVLGGRRLGASATDLSRLTGLDIACISRYPASESRPLVPRCNKRGGRELQRMINMTGLTPIFILDADKYVWNFQVSQKSQFDERSIG